VSVKIAPSHTHLVEVRLKPEFADAEGASALQLLREQGLSALREARSSKVYELVGPMSANQAHQAARDLLCDPVTQEFRLLSPAGAAVLNGMNAWRVEVWLKPTVTDPVGLTVIEAAADIGLPRPTAVRCGSAYRLIGRALKPQLEKAVAKCLANPLIHRVVVSEAHS
jgi:phosphoribosylformylglycinamidine (FGAM) synthase PurS component